MAALKDSDVMPFGKKHLGEKLGDVPASYLVWAYYNTEIDIKFPELHEYIMDNLKRLEAEHEEARAEWFEANKHKFKSKYRRRA